MGREGRREERQKTRVSGEGGEERLHETESWKRERERERGASESNREAQRKKAASVNTVKSWIFLLIIPPLPRFNYSPPELSVCLRV